MIGIKPSHRRSKRESSTIWVDVWFDDASGKVKIIIRIEQGLLEVTEVMEYFQNKHPNMLIKDIDLHILSIAWDELYESDDDDQKAGEHLGAITEQFNE